MMAASEDAKERVAIIYERYASHIAAYALRRTGSADAADAVAETFLVTWRRRDVVPDEPHTLPWLYGVTRKVLANQHRSRRRSGRLRDRLVREFTAHDVRTPPVEHVDALEHVEEYRRVAAALNELSESDAELLRLTAWEALTPTEIAAVFGIAPGTARQRISRARKRLQKQLGTDLDECEIVDRSATNGLQPKSRPRPNVSANPAGRGRNNVVRTIPGGSAS